jgi:hypothetical protein
LGAPLRRLSLVPRPEADPTMTVHRGRVIVRLENVTILKPDEETHRKVVSGFRGMDNEQLLYVLAQLSYELNRRGLVMTDS